MMYSLSWNKSGEKFYETGVDRGVLYVEDEPGVAWNGLVRVTEGYSGGDPIEYYIDGEKYVNDSSPDEVTAIIEAYTYPKEFEACTGTTELKTGLHVKNQPKKNFGISYRTGVGNDLDGPNHGYKIHMIYNALAFPSEVSYFTRSVIDDPTMFTWEINTMPLRVAGHKSSAHLVIDSREVGPQAMFELEKILYGDDGGDARLPTIDEFVGIFDSVVREVSFEAVPHFGTFNTEARKWANGTLAPDGKIYCLPFQANDLLVIDPTRGEAYTRGVGLSMVATAPKYNSTMLSPDGKTLWGLPYRHGVSLYDTEWVISVDLESMAGQFHRIDTSYALRYDAGWTATMGDDGYIYGVPTWVSAIMKYDPGAPTANYLTSRMGDYEGVSSGVGAGRYRGVVKTDRGHIYAIPNESSTIAVIKPEENFAYLSSLGANLNPAIRQYHGGALGPDGKIYCPPHDADSILIIDPDTERATNVSMGLSTEDLEGPAKWAGAVTGRNGIIYGIPSNSDSVLIINPYTQTARREVIPLSVMQETEKWNGGVLADDHSIYCTPHKGSTILRINT